ncbi:MAG: hypothetical protein EA398_11795 [Deltaproteobacteria bacterium]|nr:MAG: hypothetical protein EA398_11795 [Deltaproteobacteria bacterium]
MPADGHVIFLVADSLRYDSAHLAGQATLPYTESRSTRFSQMRSAGCWTLPATGSMFTGLLPSEHGATTQTRDISRDVPTVAERYRDAGYRTVQITANPATTHIFGLDRGFDEVHRVWTLADRRHGLVDTILSILARPRIRRKLLTDTEDFVAGRLAEDVNAARSWMQSNAEMQFDMARRILRECENRGQKAFLFINLMESHFPYHIADTFEPSRDGVIWRAKEIVSLFHLANQTRLTVDREVIAPPMLLALRDRQRRAWNRLAPMIDAFLQEMHEDTGNHVFFGSDHGDNFGEQNWEYHFSNVNDAGTHVLFHALPPDAEPRTIHTPVSARHIHGTLLAAGQLDTPDDPVDVVAEPERSLPIQESYWYNKDNKTLPQYRFNQFAFIADHHKYVLRNTQWLRSRIAGDQAESLFEVLPPDACPVHDVELDPELRTTLLGHFDHFLAYSRRVGTGR